MGKHLLLLLTFCMSILLTVSCGKSNAGAVKIGVLTPAVTHGWVAAVTYFAEEECKALGDKAQYKICTSSNAEEMTTQMEELLAWGANVIVTAPQWKGMDAPMKRAMKAGVKVVMFDMAIDAPEAYLVSGDNESMGIGSAKYLVEKLGKNATIAVLEVPTSGTVSELRVKGFMDTIAEIAPDTKLLKYATKFTREDGQKDFADILTANPRIDGVFSLDDEISIGVLQAIKEAGRTDIKVVTGGGGCQAYFKMMPQYPDIYIQSATYSPAMIKTAIDVAFDLACGKAAPQKTVIPTTIVDRENCAEFLNENSPY